MKGALPQQLKRHSIVPAKSSALLVPATAGQVVYAPGLHIVYKFSEKMVPLTIAFRQIS